MHEKPRGGSCKSKVFATQKKPQKSQKYGIGIGDVDFKKFADLVQNEVTNRMTYLCDLECTLVGGLHRCLVALVDAVQNELQI